MLCCVWFFATPWSITHQAPLSMEFPRQEYWSRLPFPTLGELPDKGIEPVFLMCPALPGRFLTTVLPGEGNGNPLQYFCLGNPMDRGTWWATVHGVTKSQTLLSTHIKSNQKRRYRKRDQLEWSLLPRHKHVCPYYFIYGYHSTMSQILYKSAICLIKNDIC